MNNILEIKNLNINISDKLIIVRNININIKKAQTIALVGESGSGKSMIAHSILNLLPRGANFNLNGEINFLEKNILELSNKDLEQLRGNEISMIFQEPMTALNPLHTVFKQISEILEVHNLYSKKVLEEKVLELLKKVELDAYSNLEKISNSYPHELSGGQRQRVGIAIAIANKPKLLIADEPTTALDVTIQYQILKLLKKLQEEYQMSILLITHDLNVVKKYSDYIYVIKDGIIKEQNLTKELFANPKDEYTKMLLSTVLQANTFDETNKKEILEIKNLSVNFPLTKGFFRKVVHNFLAVNNVNFSLLEGESFGIIGESGSGKSSLAQAILILTNSTGEINFDKINIKNLHKKELQKLRAKMQIVFQDPFNSLNPRMSIFEIISEGLDIHTSLNKKEKEIKVLNILKEVDLPKDSLERFPHEFSGGQRQRIALARALILEPKLLILDEPTSALDRQVQFQLLELLKSLQKKYNLTYIFISHDLEVIQSICNRVAVMKEGKIVENNYVKELFSNPTHSYTKELIQASK
ncbi:MAG: ABC transporter ATP-binding protein [Campylobacteraceae bacterium]|nr:ABC transporter ATP-binding protein [Campylobacteraceae bacterium]